MDFAFSKVDIEHEDLLDCTEDIMEAIDVDGDGDITRVGVGTVSANNLFLLIPGGVHRARLPE